ncbi:NAD(+) synthetase [Marinomonas sp. MED121]|uniref:hypothetical protein n=1 Tax=Marinomonas sp. MED121 TaxID=314277 RepID=UPI0000691044|nr:hypothetical protein [Marinomonas sp. MED121]EAQ67308.1 NAD(+) synthetase [Marinomonas sp. MED121]
MKPACLPAVTPFIFTSFAGLFSLLFSINSFAEGTLFGVEVENETSFYQPDYLLELAYGPDMTHIELGMDFQKEQSLGFAGLYLSRTEYDMTGADTATMTAIGIRGLKYSSSKDDTVGADLHLGINQTKAGDYERSGVEFSLNFYESLTEDTSLLLGFSFRPEFLAFDWNEGVITESGLEFGVNHKFNSQTNLFAKYYYENLWQDNISSDRIDDGLLVGFNYLF